MKRPSFKGRCTTCLAQMEPGMPCRFCTTGKKFAPKTPLEVVPEPVVDTIANVTSLRVYCPEHRKIEPAGIDGKPKRVPFSESVEVLATLACRRQVRVITTLGKVGA